MYRNIKLKIMNVFVILILAVSIPVISGYFSYEQTNGELSGISTDLSGVFAPFQEYDPFDVCVDNFVVQSETEEEIFYEDFDMNFRNIECHEYPLYSVVNYMLQDKDNLKMIYANSLTASEQQAAINFANLIGISYESESVGVVDYSTIFIGESSQSIASVGDRDVSGGEVYVLEGEMNYILVNGEVEDLLSKFTNIEADFLSTSGCFVYHGCDSLVDSNSNDVVSNQEVLSFVESYLNNEASKYSTIIGIGSWINN